jgi:hypothetical protein
MMLMAEHDYHVVELHRLPEDVLNWLDENMDGKWFRFGNKIYFTDARDHMMFLLRWS